MALNDHAVRDGWNGHRLFCGYQPGQPAALSNGNCRRHPLFPDNQFVWPLFFEVKEAFRSIEDPGSGGSEIFAAEATRFD
jgi:hypothetical protein